MVGSRDADRPRRVGVEPDEKPGAVSGVETILAACILVGDGGQRAGVRA